MMIGFSAGKSVREMVVSLGLPAQLNATHQHSDVQVGNTQSLLFN